MKTWVDQLARLRRTFRCTAKGSSRRRSVQRELVTLRCHSRVFEVEVIEFDSHDAAREALLCVSEDSMSMEDVATEGRYPFRHERLVLENIAPDAAAAVSQRKRRRIDGPDGARRRSSALPPAREKGTGPAGSGGSPVGSSSGSSSATSTELTRRLVRLADRPQLSHENTRRGTAAPLVVIPSPAR